MSGELRSSIEKQNAEFAKAFNAGDGSRIAALYANDAVLLPPEAEVPEGMIKGRAKISEFWQGTAKVFTDLVFTTISVNSLGDMAACEIGAFKVVTKNANKIPKTGRYVVVWRKIKDEWLLSTDIADWHSKQRKVPRGR